MEEKSKILIIEDSMYVRDLLLSVLKSKYQLLFAKGITQARSKLKNETIDLVLLDHYLDDGLGINFCREIKEKKEWNAIPVIILTSESSNQSIVDGLKSGANDYIKKPFYNEELFMRIEGQIRMQKARTLELKEEGIKLFKVALATLSHEVNNQLTIALANIRKIEKQPRTSEVDKLITSFENLVETMNDLRQLNKLELEDYSGNPNLFHLDKKVSGQ